MTALSQHLRNRYILAVIVSFVLFPAQMHAEWETLFTKEEITAQRMKMPESSVMKFRAHALFDASIAQIMAVILDYRTQPAWNTMGYNQKILQKLSDTELFFYSAMRAPWPFKDRDLAIKLETRVDKRAKKVYITAREIAHVKAPVEKKRVRLPVSRVEWILNARKKNTTQITMTFHIDLGGVLPAWIANRVSRDIPFYALRNIRNLIAEQKYDKNIEKKFLKYRLIK